MSISHTMNGESRHKIINANIHFIVSPFLVAHFTKPEHGNQAHADGNTKADLLQHTLHVIWIFKANSLEEILSTILLHDYFVFS